MDDVSSGHLTLLVDNLGSPIGPLLIAVDREGFLRAALFTTEMQVLRSQLQHLYGRDGFTLEEVSDPSGVSTAIAHYFAGELDAIEGIRVATSGTAFQREVWDALREIPCGSTTSYGELASRIGRPKAVRAVGVANGANPIAVVVPCHRVIGSSGALTGYGGGIERKRWLLDHERRPSRLF